MKIDSSSGKSGLSALQNRQNLKTPVPGKPAVSSSADSPVFSRNELLSRSVDSLMKLLNPSDKLQDVLRSLLKMIPRFPSVPDGLWENSSDTRLLFRVLKQFRMINEKSLPDKILHELRFVEKTLEQIQSSEEDRLLFFTEDQRLGRPEIKIDREQSSSEESDETHQIIMYLDLNILGRVSVLIGQRGDKRECLIQTTDRESRDRIKKDRGTLEKRLKQNNLRLDKLRIQFKAVVADAKNTLKDQMKQNKRLNLWG